METKRVWVTREELYKQAWSEPLQKLSKQYGLSDVGLAKICRKLQIPLPGVGYWQKKQYGKPAQQAPLPPPKGDLPKAVEMSGPREPAAANPEIDSTLAFERLPENRIHVSPVLTSPHPYVARTGDILKKSKPDQKGFVALKGRKCLGIRVSPENIDRALRLMDALVKAMEVRVFNISLDSENEDVSS